MKDAKAGNDGVLSGEINKLVQKYISSWRVTKESALLGHLCTRERDQECIIANDKRRLHCQ